MDYIQIITTIEKEVDAKKIANLLVKEKLSACVQIIGQIKSIYKWKNKIESSEEYLLFIKTKESLYEDVEKAIKKIHPYETPEIIAIPIIKGDKKYLDWIDENIKITSNAKEILKFSGKGGVDEEKIKDLKEGWKRWTDKYS